MLNYMQCLLVE